MPIYLVKARRAIRTIESAIFNIEASDPVTARRLARAKLREDDCEWQFERGPLTSEANIEEIEILASGDEEIPEKS